MNIIKQNPFRVLGLTGNVKERELQRQINVLKRYAEIGQEKSFDYDFDFIGDLTRNPEEIQEASNKIEQAYKKFLYSLFWFVKNTPFDEIAFNNLKDNDIDKAIEIWNKTLKEEISAKNYSSYLNLSTLYIALSTVEKQIDLEKLQTGISLKGNLIHSDSLKDLSKLITGNGVANDPIQISENFVDELIELLNPYLDKSTGISTNDLISFFDSFPSSIQKYILSKFTEVPISNIENKIEKTIHIRNENPGNAEEHGEELYKTTINDIAFLKKMLGSSHVQYQMIANKLANEILQCSIDFFNDRLENDNDNNFERNLNKAIKLVKLADSVAESSQVKQRAKESIETLNGMRDREINQAIALLKSVKDAYKKNEEQIRLEVTRLEATDIDIRLGFKSINQSALEKNIKNSINWNKVVELIIEAIPSRNIEKIKNINNESKSRQFKELVDFILDKMSYSNKKRVEYLCYWKDDNSTPRTISTTTTTSPTARPPSDSTDKTDLSYLPWVIGIVAGIIGAIAAGIGGFVISAIIGGIIGVVIKNNQ